MRKKVFQNEIFQKKYFVFKVKVRALVGSQLASYSEQFTNKFNWKTPKHIINKPSQLPAIERPLPGMSYNPSYDAHQVEFRNSLSSKDKKHRFVSLGSPSSSS